MEVNILPNTEFKTLVIRMPNELRGKINKLTTSTKRYKL